MDVVFLGARVPMTKTYVDVSGRIVAKPYPLVSKVTSFHESFNTLAEFAELLKTHAVMGRCLFNGQLVRPLSMESRANMTEHGPRQWVVFDFDKVQASDHAEVVRKYLPAACQDVSYVVQHSASMYRHDFSGWSGHIFMLLEQPADERFLKQWMEHLNFTVPALTSELALSQAKVALHWPLDRTAAYNARITYIAPPKCVGFTPPNVEHIKYIAKRKQKVAIPAFTAVDSVMIRQKVNELRRNEGLPDIDYNVQAFQDNSEVIRDIGEVEIHDIRTSGNHYIRFNINGGDSYAYYIDLRAPDLIRNFKGEPFMKTEEVAPKLLEALVKTKSRVLSKPPLDDDCEVLAFYATNRGSNVMTGLFNPNTQELRLDQSKETPAYAWLSEHGVPLRTLPHMDIVFDPSSEVRYVRGLPVINTFKPTRYMLMNSSLGAPSTLAEIPPTINKMMQSMMGNPTPEVQSHFMNWLSFIFKQRRKTGTAWVMHGVQGSGKSLFIKSVLSPIFGSSHVKNVQFSMIAKPYNGFLEDAMFVVFEESDTKAVGNAEALDQKLKHWITDEIVTIEEKRVTMYQAKTFCNFIFFSNNMSPVLMPNDDRRYNVCERQGERWYPTPNELKVLADGSELEAFVDVLSRWPVDELMVTKVIETKAKRDIHEATTSINQLIAEAIMRGDLAFFSERMPSEAEATADFFNRFNPMGMYKNLLERFNTDAHAGGVTLVSDEDLFVLFRTLITDARYFQDSKTWRLRHYKSLGLDLKKTRVPGTRSEYMQAIRVKWTPCTNIAKKVISDDTVVAIPRRKR